MTMLPGGIEGKAEQTAVPQGRFVSLGDHYGPIAVSSHDNEEGFMLLDMTVDFQGGPPPHVHNLEDETFIVTRGRFRVVVDEERFEVGPGDIIYAPRHHGHCWQCISEEGAHVLVLITPGQNFESFATTMDHLRIMPPTTPEAIQQVVAVCEEHAVNVLPPVW